MSLIRINHDEPLLHGTSTKNLRGIMQRGLVPGGGYSPHRTKTAKAVFFTDSLPMAMMYASAFERRDAICVVAVDVKGLALEPDWDDAATGIEVQLDELRKAVRNNDLELGKEIPEDLVEKVEHEIEGWDMWGSRMLSVEYDKSRRAVLYVEPYVEMNVETPGVSPEAYDNSDINFNDGEAMLTARQFMCLCVVPTSRVQGAFLNAAAVRALGVRAKPEGKTKETFYGETEPGEDEHELWFQQMTLGYYPRKSLV